MRRALLVVLGLSSGAVLADAPPPASTSARANRKDTVKGSTGGGARAGLDWRQRCVERLSTALELAARSDEQFARMRLRVDPALDLIGVELAREPSDTAPALAALVMRAGGAGGVGKVSTSDGWSPSLAQHSVRQTSSQTTSVVVPGASDLYYLDTSSGPGAMARSGPLAPVEEPSVAMFHYDRPHRGYFAMMVAGLTRRETVRALVDRFEPALDACLDEAAP